MSTTTRPLLRWSSVKDCPRKATYEAERAPARERTDREERILFRGRRLGRDYADMLDAKYPGGVEREVKVEWPLGVGHIDIVLTPTKTAIEVLSSAHASEPMIHSKLLQLVGYMEHYPPVENGCLIVLNPADYSEDRYPVSKQSGAYESLAEEMRGRIATLERWRDFGDTPDRVCRKPSEAIGRWCLHAEHCFDGWEPPDLPTLSSPEVLEAAANVANLKLAEQVGRKLLAADEALRKEAEARLASLLEGQPAKVQVGPYAITRTDTRRQPTLDWRKAELAGVLNVEALAEYMKPGAAYTTWSIQRTEARDDDIDYGQVPF